MQVIKPTKVETTYRHKKTGELFKEITRRRYVG